MTLNAGTSQTWRRRRPAQRLPGPTEEAIHRAVIGHLTHRAAAGVVYWHTPNGDLRKPGVAGRLRAMGTLAGVPDILLLSNGLLYGLELKGDRGRLSEAQRQTITAFEAAGATIAVCRGVDEALGALSDWRLISSSRK